MRLLITGGAGYIGSHTAKLAAARGYLPVSVDNLTTGNADRVRWGPLVQADIRDTAAVKDALAGVSTVLHLAAHAKVSESIANPAMYFQNNTAATLTLLNSMLDAGVRHLVFASSCSVYGLMRTELASESDPAYPVSPYGESKLLCEQVLRWYEQAYGLRWLALRYFNVAGVEPGTRLGEDTARSSRVVPKAVEAVLGRNCGPFRIFGSSYETADGTAVRDYVNVRDVATANLLAVQHLERGGESGVVNIGSGSGISVRQILDETARAASGGVPTVDCEARAGDPGCVIADARRSLSILGWTPVHSNLPEIVRSELDWQRGEDHGQ